MKTGSGSSEDNSQDIQTTISGTTLTVTFVNSSMESPLRGKRVSYFKGRVTFYI